MSQHYPSPHDVLAGWPATNARARNVEYGRRNRRLQATLTREGQIVPLLVRTTPREGVFAIADDPIQAERLGALQALDWPTVLVETEWGEEDL